MHYKKAEISKSTCTGCGACVYSCPKRCLVLKKDKMKRYVPFVNENDCIDCKKCKKLCPQNNEIKRNTPRKCFVAWSKDNETITKSASGGVAKEMSKFAYQNGYIAFGCDYNKDNDLCFFEINGDEDLIRAQSSKYSFSYLYSVLDKIVQLSKKKKILFIGMPCQIAAIRSLPINRNNVILVDIVCHGMPPNDYLKEHIRKVTHLRAVGKIRFRGEYDQKLTIWRNNEIIYQKDRETDLYFRAFYSNMISYDSCYSCKYATKDRVSDITIGDFWGLGELKTINKQSSRPSLVLVNNDIGMNFFDSLKKSLVYEERDLFEGIEGNGRLNKSPGKNLFANSFSLLYPLFGYKAISISFFLSKVKYIITKPIKLLKKMAIR